jgi:hypothetical protein
MQPHRLAARLDIFEEIDDPRVRTRADDAVDFGDQALQLRAVALGQTAGDDQLLSGALARRVLEDGLRRLFLRGIDEGAGVDDDGIRAARLRF